MKKLMTLILAASCFVAVPTLGFEGTRVGNDEFMEPTLDPAYGEVKTAEEEALARRLCPRGWRLVPRYRWDFWRHRWVFAGWTCRRSYRRHNPYPGYPRDPRGPWQQQTQQ